MSLFSVDRRQNPKIVQSVSRYTRRLFKLNYIYKPFQFENEFEGTERRRRKKERKKKRKKRKKVFLIINEKINDGCDAVILLMYVK